MPQATPFPIEPPPGVVKTETDRVIEGRFSDTEKVRFTNGRAEKIGGWLVQTVLAIGDTLRTLMSWRDLLGDPYVAAGTHRKLYVYDKDFVSHDITPQRATGTYANNPITTTNGSTSVSIAHVGHGLTIGDTVTIAGATAVGGITIAGTYLVTLVTSANAFTITHSAPASSGATGGGAAVTYGYEIGVGAEYAASGFGYGVGGYGLSTYGTARGQSTLVIEPRVWSLDHMGKILLAAYNTGRVYSWDPQISPAWDRATLITDSPTDVRFLFVTAERHAVALCENLRIAWCTQGDYTEWTPTGDNTANERRLGLGTRFIGGRALGQGLSLIWTDAGVYVMQWTGSKLVYDTRLIASECGLLSPSAAVRAGMAAYWMGHNTFWMYNGGVQQMPNVDNIRKFVYDNLRADYGYLCWGSYNPKFNEVWWFYVATGDADPSHYIIFDIDTAEWAVGTMERVSGTFFSDGETNPLWAGHDGHLYRHENGVDANGVAMAASLTLAPYAMEEGSALLDLEGLVVDFEDQSGDLTLTVSAWDKLRGATIDSETRTMGDTDSVVDLRICGRYIGLTIGSNEVGGFFRFGKPVALAKPSGSRRQ